MTQVWARALAAGVDDGVFWASTPVEVRTLVDAYQDDETQRQRAENERAGLITAAVYNVNRRKGARAYKPGDFFTYADDTTDTAGNLRTALIMWGESTRGVTVQ